MKPKKTRRAFLRDTGAAAGGVAASALLGQGCSRAEVAGERPNILVLFPDQHRPDWTQANPAVPVPTPNLAALSARGVTLERAVCASPVCAPSRACLATGREYEHCGVATNRDNLPAGTSTVYGRLRDSGYWVMGCGKFDLATGDLVSGRGLSLDGRRHMASWGFSDGINNAGKGAGAFIYMQKPPQPRDAYHAYLDSLDPPLAHAVAADYERRNAGESKASKWADTSSSPVADEHYCDNWIGRKGLSLLDAAPADRPWFLQVNFMGPHQPMDITARMEARFRGPERVIADFPGPHDYHGDFDARLHLRIRQNYAAMIENIDRWVGLYLQRLEARGELENTIVIYASDHGEMLGDHSRWGKVVPHQPSVGVPLVVSGPGVETGRRSSALVSLIDLTATVLDYGGLEAPPDVDGFSLRRLLEGQTDEHREWVLSGLYDWRMVWDGRYKLITDFEGTDVLLYDHQQDPLEDVDIAAVAGDHRQRLLETLQRGSFFTA